MARPQLEVVVDCLTTHTLKYAAQINDPLEECGNCVEELQGNRRQAKLYRRLIRRLRCLKDGPFGHSNSP